MEKAAVKRQKMTDADLVSIIRSHRADALGVEDGDLSNQRSKAMDHYHGRPYGNEVEGRSQVVSRDLAEAIDWAMPGIMRLFTQSGSLGEFDPIGPDDEQLAQQESDYTNQVMMRDNDGFMVLHDAIKDTLLLKTGYTKHIWDVEEKIEEVEYTGLSMDQVVMMLQSLEKEGAEVEIVGQDSAFVDMSDQLGMQQNQAQQIMQPMLVEMFDIKLKIKREKGKVLWLAVPSEEVRVSKKCRGTLQQSPFTEHVTRKTRSDLIEMGMDADFVYGLPSWSERDNSSQSVARDSIDDESEDLGNTSDRSMDEIQYCEAYIRVDWDGDGIAELRKVVTVADKIPKGDDWNEPLAAVPMTAFVAKRVPHRHIGESLDDEIADLQEIMTVLKRQLLDNIYRVNNGEMAINEDANLRDFMTSTPGGIKRIKGHLPAAQSFAPIITQPIIDKILPVVDFFERSKENRTGISKQTTGMDPDSLEKSTKGAFLENLNRASQKMEMIARMLAETGVKESMLQVHSLLIRHQDKPRMVKMRGQWINVNPREWQERTDLQARVGLGTGNEEQKQQKLMMLSQMQDKAAQAGLVGPKQVYAMFEDVAKTLGADVPGKYIITPDTPEHEAQKQIMAGGAQTNQLAEAEQVKAQAALQVQQMRDQAHLQVEAAKQNLQREKDAFMARFEAMDREAERRHESAMKAAELRAQADREILKQEVALILGGMKMDLGRAGIGAGVQGPGAPLPAGEPPQEAAAPQFDQPTEPQE